MKVIMLLLSLFVSIHAYGPNEKPGHFDNGMHSNQTKSLLSALPTLYLEQSLPPKIQDFRFETQLAGVSKADQDSQVAKSGLDEKAGSVNWTTAILILCVAGIVYLINRNKKQDMD